MSIIVSNCQCSCKFVPYFGVVESVPRYESQHCDEQQFQTLSCVHYTIFSVVKLDLFIRALLLDRILALEKKTTRTPRVHLVLCVYQKHNSLIKNKGTHFLTNLSNSSQ